MQETAHFYSPFQFALRFGVSTKSVYRWIHRGTMKASRVEGQWRIPRNEYCRRCAGNNGCNPCTWRGLENNSDCK